MYFKGWVCGLALIWVTVGCHRDMVQTTDTEKGPSVAAKKLIEEVLAGHVEVAKALFVSPENMGDYFQGADEKVVAKFKPELTGQADTIKKGQLRDLAKLGADLKSSGISSGHYGVILSSDKKEKIGRNLVFEIQVDGKVKAVLLISGYKVTRNGYLMARLSSLPSKDLRR